MSIVAMFRKFLLGRSAKRRKAMRRNPKRRGRRKNPLPRWVDRRSIRTIFRGKGKKYRRLLVGCPKGSWKKGRCRKGMRLIEKKRANNPEKKRFGSLPVGTKFTTHSKLKGVYWMKTAPIKGFTGNALNAISSGKQGYVVYFGADEQVIPLEK
jgi:hypothetical protein